MKVQDNKILELSYPISNLNVLMISNRKIENGNYNKWIKKGTELLCDTIMFLIFNQVISIRHHIDKKNILFRFLKYKPHSYCLNLDSTKLIDKQIGWLEKRIIEVLTKNLNVHKDNYTYKELIVDVFDSILEKDKQHHSPGAKFYEMIVVNDDISWFHEYHSYLSIINIHELRFKSKLKNDDIVQKEYNLFKREIKRLIERNSEIERFRTKLMNKINWELTSRKTPDSD